MIQRNRNQGKRYILLLCIIVILSLLPYRVSRAASASITLGADKTSVTKGDEVQVTVQLSSDAILGDFEAFLAYNNDVLEFKEGASFIAGGDGLLKITDMTAAGDEKSRKYVIHFLAVKVGSCEITLKDNPELYDYESGDSMSVSSNDLTVTVAAQKTASSNADLKSLIISPGTLAPEFDKDVTNYKTRVSSDIQSLIISAAAKDSGATVTTQGNDTLETGTNSVTVTVKAESGTKKLYYIEVYREEAAPETGETSETADSMEQSEDESLEETVPLNALTVKQEGNDIYLINGFRYKILTPDSLTDLPEGYTAASLKIQGVTITAYAPENNQDSEFLLLYAKNESGETGFYQYDRVENTIQRYNKNQSSASGKYVLSDEIMQSEEYKSKITTLGIIIGILGSLLIAMSILLIHVYTKPKE